MRLLVIAFLWKLSIVLLSVKYSSAQTESVDRTLFAGATGVEVVEASIRKLSVLQEIFKNDFGFLKRIALVESGYGNNQRLPLGGIWQISEEMHKYVTSHQDFNTDLQVATDIIGTIKPTEEPMTYNANVPIWSAFLARLFLKFQAEDNGMSLPRNITGQANWWNTYYNTSGDEDQFINEVEAYEESNKCNASLLDLFFVLDHSSSLSPEDFNASLKFVIQLSSRFPISSQQVRTGLMLFSRRVEFVSRFNEHRSNVAFIDAINNIPDKKHSGTRAGQALNRVFERGFIARTGARPASQGVPRILIMLTDGKSQDNVTEPANQLRAAGVTIFAIGVGNAVDNEQLNIIASDPDTEYAYTFDNFDNLVEIFGDRLTRLSCEVPRIIPNNTAVDVLLHPGSPSYGVVKTSNEGRIGEIYVTLSTQVQNVGGNVFLSSFFPNPNAALHDFLLPIRTGTNTTRIEPSETMKRRNLSQVFFTFMPTGTMPFETQIKVVGSEVGSIATAAPKTKPSSKPTSTTPEPSEAAATQPITFKPVDTERPRATLEPSEPAATLPATFKPVDRERSSITDQYQTEITKEMKDKSPRPTGVVQSETPAATFKSGTESTYTNATVQGSGSRATCVLSPFLGLLVCVISILWVS